MTTQHRRRRGRVIPVTIALAGVVLVGVVAMFGPSLWDAWRFQSAINTEAKTAAVRGRSARALAQTCGLCHGLDGNGESQVYPHLAGEPAGYIEAQLNAFASGARRAPQMQPLAMDLTAGERRMIDRYYAALPVVRNTAFASGRGTDPRAASIATPCAACHGAKFRGGSSPVLAPRLAGQARDYLARQLRAFRSGERNDPTGSMTSVARTLTDADIDTVATDLAGR